MGRAVAKSEEEVRLLLLKITHHLLIILACLATLYFARVISELWWLIQGDFRLRRERRQETLFSFANWFWIAPLVLYWPKNTRKRCNDVNMNQANATRAINELNFAVANYFYTCYLRLGSHNYIILHRQELMLLTKVIIIAMKMVINEWMTMETKIK